MLEATEEIKDKLREQAHEMSRPFCYMDYITVPLDEDDNAVCPKCGTDDLMRELEGVGVEYGYDWIMEHIVKEEGTAIDADEMYDDLLDECNEPFKLGDLEYSPSQVLKNVDPTAYEMGKHEYLDSLVEDGQLVCLGDTYYQLDL
ncbi:MAG: hypothetical protein K2X81_23035 [Candidatus Obscuribacterales bacterium]|nr:hypothetical protein [Candidatus Obscuribacterales bacterium]